jgi:hypothetical protein
MKRCSVDVSVKHTSLAPIVLFDEITIGTEKQRHADDCFISRFTFSMKGWRLQTLLDQGLCDLIFLEDCVGKGLRGWLIFTRSPLHRGLFLPSYQT